VVVSLNIVDREILDLERGQRIAERMVMGVRVEEFYMGEEREARQGWLKLRVGGFGTQRTRAAMPHYARAGVALLSGGKGYGDDEKGVEVGDNVIVDTVFDGDCQPQRREQLACSYAASRCSTGEVIQLIAESEITFLSSVQYTTTEKTDANVIQGCGSKLQQR